MAPSARLAPFPTADSQRLVIRVVERVAQGVRSPRTLAEALGLELRQIEALVYAAIWLGLAEGEGEVLLTPLGLELAYAGKAKNKVWARAVWAQPFVSSVLVGPPAALPSLDALTQRIASEPGVANPGAAAASIRALCGMVFGPKKVLLEERQLDLPLAPAPAEEGRPRPIVGAAREYDPDVHRYLLCALLDHGELGLGQIRALLDRAKLGEAPLGGYVDLLVTRGEAVRMDERLVASVQAIARRDLAETTTSVVLSDPGYRAYLADFREAAAGGREAQIRRDKLRPRYRTWDRRLFGRDIDPDAVEVELNRVLMDRSLGSFPTAKGPGTAPLSAREPFLDAWRRSDLAIALPPSLATLRGGLAAVNHALKSARLGAADVAIPEVAHRPSLYHGGIVHPGEPLPRTIPDLRSLRARLVAHAPYATLATATLLLHRRLPERLAIVRRRGSYAVYRGAEELGDWLDVLDRFAVSRGWTACRRSRGGLSTSTFASALEACGVLAVAGSHAVLSERFFAQLRSDAEELELHVELAPLAEQFDAWVEQAEAA